VVSHPEEGEMSDLLGWLQVATEVGGYLGPILQKNRLKSALIKRGKSPDEAKLYILSLEFMKSDYVKMIIGLPDAAKWIPTDEAMRMMLPLVIEIIMDDEYAGIWFKDQFKISRMRSSIIGNNWVDLLS
jgi:hypothetical protein